MDRVRLADITHLILGERCHLLFERREIRALVDLVTPDGRVAVLLTSEEEMMALGKGQAVALEVQAQDAVYQVAAVVESTKLDLPNAGRPQPRVILRVDKDAQNITRTQRRNDFRLKIAVDARFLVSPFASGLPQSAALFKAHLRTNPAERRQLTLNGHTVDVSGGGILMDTEVELAANKELALELLFPPEAKGVFVFAARVIRVRDLSTPRARAFRAAIAFVDVKERERDDVVRYLMAEEMRRRRNRR